MFLFFIFFNKKLIILHHLGEVKIYSGIVANRWGGGGIRRVGLESKVLEGEWKIDNLCDIKKTADVGLMDV